MNETGQPVCLSGISQWLECCPHACPTCLPFLVGEFCVCLLWVRLRNQPLPSVEGNSGFGGVLLQLVKSTGTESVSADQARLPAFTLVVVGQL